MQIITIRRGTHVILPASSFLFKKFSQGNVSKEDAHKFLYVYDDERDGLFHYAVAFHHSSLVQELIRAGWDVNVRNMWGQTPLHLAAGLGLVDMVNTLIVAKCDRHPLDIHHHTPAMYAVSNGLLFNRYMPHTSLPPLSIALRGIPLKSYHRNPLMWQWNVSLIEKAWELSDEDIEEVFIRLVKPPSLEDQPVWSLEEKPDHASLKHLQPSPSPPPASSRMREANGHQPLSSCSSPHKLGSYQYPSQRNVKYGIFLYRRNIEKWIEEYFPPCWDPTGRFDIRKSALLAFVFWHEVYHAWLDDLCTLAETMTGVPHSAFLNCSFIMVEVLADYMALGMVRYILSPFISDTSVQTFYSQLVHQVKQNAQNWPYRNSLRPPEGFIAHHAHFIYHTMKVLILFARIPYEVVLDVCRRFFPPSPFLYPNVALAPAPWYDGSNIMASVNQLVFRHDKYPLYWIVEDGK